MYTVKTVIKCDDCPIGNNTNMRNVQGRMTCIKCGLISNHYVFVPDLIYLMKKNKRTKSVHKRNKWFQKRIREIVPGLMIDVLTDDFIKVVNVLINKKLIKKNVSRYNYYIIRLCNRRNVKIAPAAKLQDMNEGKTKCRFDDNLFGIVYKCLNWSKGARKNCKYYRQWNAV